jgi:hypothetical protein
MNASSTCYWRRLWRRVHHGRNTLARPSDRFESALLICSVLVALVALPFSASAGSETYAHQKYVSEKQTSTRYPATATLLADGPAIDLGGREITVDNPAPTAATWTLAEGKERSGTVSAGQGTLKGETVPIWLDQSGNAVDPPIGGLEVVRDSLGVGLGSWLGLCLVLVGLCWLTRSVLDRFRFAKWQQEWFQEQDRWSRP